MKIIRALLLSLFVLNTSCDSKYEMSEQDRIADHMILEFAETVAAKGLRPAGIGGGLNHETGKHKEFGITFTTQEEIKNIAHARALFVETADDFLKFINKREDIREYLDVFPVTIQNIDMAIICSNAQQGDIVDISNCLETLHYYTAGIDPDRDSWTKVLKETFEEAHRKLLE